MKKHIISLLLAMLMLLSLVPATALAHNTYTLQYQETNPHYQGVLSPVESWHQPLFFGAQEDNVTYYGNADEVAAAIRQGMVNRESAIQVGIQRQSAMASEDMRSYFHAALDETDSPEEGDYLGFQYTSYSVSASGSIRSGTYYYVLTYYVEYFTTKAQEDAVTAQINALMPQFTSLQSDYAKLRAIYHYITANITYDYDNLNNSSYLLKHSAYAALINKTAVCQGYAVLLYRMLREAGIDCRVVSGTGNGGAHAWNIAKVDGKYYALDSTWDAGQSGWDYFLLSNENMAKHELGEEYTTAPFTTQYPVSTTNYVPTPVAGVTADGYCGKDLYWLLDDEGVLTISGTGDMWIGSYPWSSYSLSAVVIGDGITSIGAQSFYGCDTITSVTLGDDITVIPEAAFYGCSALSSLTLGDQVTTIGEYAFTWCSSLTTLNLPATLTTIGDYSLNACDNLQTVNFGGTEEQWAAVDKGEGNYSLNYATVTFHTAPTLTCDLNGDSVTDSADLQILARHVSGIEAIVEPAKLTQADTNADGIISAADLTTLAAYLAA